MISDSETQWITECTNYQIIPNYQNIQKFRRGVYQTPIFEYFQVFCRHLIIWYILLQKYVLVFLIEGWIKILVCGKQKPYKKETHQNFDKKTFRGIIEIQEKFESYSKNFYTEPPWKSEKLMIFKRRGFLLAHRQCINEIIYNRDQKQI